jgi:hypothetical protein
MTKICSKCAAERKLRVFAPCEAHHTLGQEIYQEPAEDVFLYDEVLQGSQIRLFYLEVGSKKDAIRGSLKTVLLDDAGVYNCLSYVWGDQTRRRKVICNGASLDIGENLFQALLTFRAEAYGDVIKRIFQIPWWIDAVCINQAIIAEKTQQVQMMRRTFSQASVVYAWLGVENKYSKDGIKQLKRLTEIVSTKFSSDENMNITQLSLKELGFPAPKSSRWTVLAHFLCLPYFSRIWIFQEVKVAQRCLFKYGSHTIHIDDLWLALTTLRVKPEAGHEIGVSIRKGGLSPTLSISPVPDVLSASQVSEDLPLITLLNMTMRSQATDPRDKVFALIGMASDTDQSFVDYNKSVHDILLELAHLYIQREGPLWFLHVRGSRRSPHMPSWVPDWTKQANATNSDVINGNMEGDESITLQTWYGDGQIRPVAVQWECRNDRVSL